MRSPQIFLSYSWKNTDIADIIEQDLKAIGISLIRDVRNLKYRESIKSYMGNIASSDYALLLISQEFLQSANCMYEILSLVKDDNYSKKVLPVILMGADIFTPSSRLQYIRYWEGKISELNKELKEVDSLANVKSIATDLELYTAIRSSIDEFVSTISDLNCIKFDDLRNKNYQPLLHAINFSEDKLSTEIIRINSIEDIEEQEVSIAQLLVEYPDNLYALLLRASLAYKTGQYKKSRSSYEHLLNLFPDFAPAHNNIGVLLFRQFGEVNLARQHYEKAIELEPEQSLYRFNLANVLQYGVEDYGLALDYYLSALNNTSHDTLVYEELGNMCQFKLNDYNKSAFYFNKALEANPGNEGALNNLANLYVRMEDYDEAERTYNELLNLDPTSHIAHGNYASFLKDKRSDYERAKQHYELALQINPMYAKGHYNYAVLLAYHYKNFSEAEKHMEMAAMIDPEYAGLTIGNMKNIVKDLCGVEITNQERDGINKIFDDDYITAFLEYIESVAKIPVNWEEVICKIHRVLEINPADDTTRRQLITILKDILGDYDEAFKNYLLILENNPDNPFMHYEVASIYTYKLKNREKAKYHYERAIELDNKYAKAHFAYAALLLLKYHDVGAAKKHYLISTEIDQTLINAELEDLLKINRNPDSGTD
jgi:tetratricopeptide (TPR) repeat protein